MTFDIVCNTFFSEDGKGHWALASAYNAAVDCILSLLTAMFSSLVLALFIGAYISLVSSIGQLRQAITEVSQVAVSFEQAEGD